MAKLLRETHKDINDQMPGVEKGTASVTLHSRKQRSITEKNSFYERFDAKMTKVGKFIGLILFFPKIMHRRRKKIMALKRNQEAHVALPVNSETPHQSNQLMKMLAITLGAIIPVYLIISNFPVDKYMYMVPRDDSDNSKVYREAPIMQDYKNIWFDASSSNDNTSTVFSFEETSSNDASEIISSQDTQTQAMNAYQINLLVQAVQHETGNSPEFYPNGDFDIVQQYMAASIINRIGQPGFGAEGTTPTSVWEVLNNPIQYGNMLNELSWFDAYDERTRANVLAVINGTVYTPKNLYFERCSEINEDYWSAMESFYNQYNTGIVIDYMSPTAEGRYIIFASNPGGAYTTS